MTKKLKEAAFIRTNINNIEDIDVNNVLVSRKETYGTKNSHKYFNGYNDNDNIRPLSIRLPQMTGYARKFNENANVFYSKR